jgi:hypothetical protein
MSARAQLQNVLIAVRDEELLQQICVLAFEATRRSVLE